MSDEAGSDAKIICVPYKDPRWAHIKDLKDVPEQTRNELHHFFSRYKDLEPEKFVNIEGWGDAAEAEQLIIDGFERLKTQGH
jgi:inorganic pyrophosphatase